MEQNMSKRICHKCGAEWDLNARYCGTCGEVLEYNKNEMFGNGLPLKYFKFMYNVLPIFSTIFLLFLTLSSYNDFINYYDSSLELYLSYYSIQFNFLNFILNYVLLGFTLYTRFMDNKIGFSKVMIYRLILAVIIPIVSLIPFYLDFGISSEIIVETLSYLISPLVMGIASTIYLTKRFDFKWFDFSQIL